MAHATLSPAPRRRSAPPIVAVFVLIPFLIEAVWVFWPALLGMYYSLFDWDGISSPEFVGLDNFSALPNDEVFVTALGHTAIWVVLFGGLSVVLGLGVALFLQAERKGVGFYRAAMFTPVVFSLVVTSLVWRIMYQPSGTVNSTLGALGLESWQRIWLADPDLALYAILVAALWRQVGYIMVLYIAGLKAIDTTLKEAAAIDGASRWQALRYVTLPQLRSVNGVVLAVVVIEALRAFDIVYALTRGGPYHSTELLSTYMYTVAFNSRRLGYGSAIAVVIFALAIGVIIRYLVRIVKETDV